MHEMPITTLSAAPTYFSVNHVHFIVQQVLDWTIFLCPAAIVIERSHASYCHGNSSHFGAQPFCAAVAVAKLLLCCDIKIMQALY